MIRVLVVEDDFRVADVNKEFVERCDGFEVVAIALTAAQAIEMNRRLQPELILLDLYLPDVHGLEIATKLRQDSGADIIVVTAARDVANVKAAMQHGALHYLVKPFQFSVIRERLDAYSKLRGVLGSDGELSQDAVDAAFSALRTPLPDLPKGLSHDTLTIVERTLHESGTELTSDQIAHISGVSKVTARRYLRFLVSAGRATAKSEYGTPGRPKHLYSIAGSSPAERS